MYTLMHLIEIAILVYIAAVVTISSLDGTLQSKIRRADCATEWLFFPAIKRRPRRSGAQDTQYATRLQRLGVTANGPASSNAATAVRCDGGWWVLRPMRESGASVRKAHGWIIGGLLTDLKGGFDLRNNGA
jgi:hypothetical protein